MHLDEQIYVQANEENAQLTDEQISTEVGEFTLVRRVQATARRRYDKVCVSSDITSEKEREQDMCQRRVFRRAGLRVSPIGKIGSVALGCCLNGVCMRD